RPLSSRNCGRRRYEIPESDLGPAARDLRRKRVRTPPGGSRMRALGRGVASVQRDADGVEVLPCDVLLARQFRSPRALRAARISKRIQIPLPCGLLTGLAATG